MATRTWPEVWEMQDSALRRGEYPQAWSFLLEATAMCNRVDELFVAAASEAEALSYLASGNRPFNGMITCAFAISESVDACYTEIWRRKAMIARVLQRRQDSLFQRATGDSPEGRLLKKWNDRRQELARLMLAPSDALGATQRPERMRQLTQDKEQLERQLADSLPGFACDQAAKRRPHGDLLVALPDRTALIDLIEYIRYDQDPQNKADAGMRSTPSYMGFVLAKGRPVQRLDLGPATAINEAVQDWRAAIVQRRTSPATATLRHLLWEPIARHLPAETKTVLIVPDGLLTAIPWAAMPGERPGTFLLEQYAFAVAPHAAVRAGSLVHPGAQGC